MKTLLKTVLCLGMIVIPFSGIRAQMIVKNIKTGKKEEAISYKEYRTNLLKRNAPFVARIDRTEIRYECFSGLRDNVVNWVCSPEIMILNNTNRTKRNF